MDKTLNKLKDFRNTSSLDKQIYGRYAVRSERLKSNLNDKISRHRGYDFVHRIPVSIMHIFVFNCKNLPRKHCPLVVSFFDVDRCGRVKLILS